MHRWSGIATTTVCQTILVLQHITFVLRCARVRVV